MNNLAIMKQALCHLEEMYEQRQSGIARSSPVDFRAFYDSLAEDVVFEVVCTSSPPPGASALDPPWNVIGRKHQGKQALIDAFNADQLDIRDWQIKRPLEYFVGGDRVVVLLAEGYVIEGSDWPVTLSEAAMVFDLRDGKITRYLHIADMSGHIAAHARRTGS